MPSQRQTRAFQQLVGSQIGRLAPIEDGLRDVRGEIAEAEDGLTPSCLASATKATASERLSRSIL
jgi:hypothetical protein